ncbi:MAG TPA: EF-P lysine aminoacylase EpmA, partial [Nevskiaceae bacterium]|nr:EF-P lysine aminoacylase EpmA [Nevskiaceae bacterium]
HIDSLRVDNAGGLAPRWLQTSPEFAMKRLLAAGSGPIYQIARVFRRDEAGRHHNPEFSLLEWYRPGWDHHALMDEVDALLQALVGAAPCERLSYAEAFRRLAGFDPDRLPLAELVARTREAGLAPEGADAGNTDRDGWLDLWMSARVGPQLGRPAPCLLYDYPASQAALARVRPGDPPRAERFELFWQGVELANGFHELRDPLEQRRRFEADQARRQALGLTVPPYDRHLIAALEAGLPDCAGVALGLDRLLMLQQGCTRLDEVLAFPAARA